jgi:hypothetical protein
MRFWIPGVTGVSESAAVGYPKNNSSVSYWLIGYLVRQLLVSWLVTGEEQTFHCAGSELKVLKKWFGVRILQWLWLEGKLWWWDWHACGRNVSWLIFLYNFTTLAWKYCVYTVLFLFNNVIYVFLLLWLRVLILCLCMTTLTEVLPCFFPQL